MSVNTPKNWFKPVVWAALVWNLLGVIAFAMHMMMTPEMIGKLPLSTSCLL